MYSEVDLTFVSCHLYKGMVTKYAMPGRNEFSKACWDDLDFSLPLLFWEMTFTRSLGACDH